jgi:molybdenum cofactor guanylyltransferase
MSLSSSLSDNMAAGIVLCGGKSSRMGRPKALLPFGPELMLPRVVRILSAVVSPIAVVAAADQELPPLPSEVLLAHDERDDRGPLEGLRAGMRELVRRGYGNEYAVYATSCDVPLLQEAFIRQVLTTLSPNLAAVPVEGQFVHSLAAAYRLAVLPEIESLLAAGKFRTACLFDRVLTTRIPVDSLRQSDPELLSLRNCNRPGDYLAALQRAGFPVEKTA